MADLTPTARGFLEDTRTGSTGLVLTDVSLVSKWRVFDGFEDINAGRSRGSGSSLVWSVSPGEWTVIGDRPDTDPTVDITHVRAMFRLSGADSHRLLNMICSLDFSDGMFPNGAAGRTLVAGVATEVIRNDEDEVPSYLIVPSRSFGSYVLDVLVDAGLEFGLS